jgi:hypothetical protein
MLSPSNYRRDGRSGLNLRRASSMLGERKGWLSKTSCFIVALRLGSCMHCVYRRDENMMNLDIHHASVMSPFFFFHSCICLASFSIKKGKPRN